MRLAFSSSLNIFRQTSHDRENFLQKKKSSTFNYKRNNANHRKFIRPKGDPSSEPGRTKPRVLQAAVRARETSKLRWGQAIELVCAAGALMRAQEELELGLFSLRARYRHRCAPSGLLVCKLRIKVLHDFLVV